MSEVRNYDVIRSPAITEKATMASEQDQVIFNVASDATKPEIKRAVEALFGVKVKSVRTAKIQPKTRKAGHREIEKRSAAKKAIITTVGAKKIDVNKIKV